MRNVSTDGAHRPIEHLGIDWHDIEKLDNDGLYRLLRELHRWEADADPSGQQLPRSKRHDDKTLAVVRFSSDPRARSRNLELGSGSGWPTVRDRPWS